MNIVNLQNIQLRLSKKNILKDINLEMDKSENWAVLGLNGSGKTSLVQIIAGYRWPTSGKVQVLGETFGECNLPVLRKRIGWVSDTLDEFYQNLPYETVFTSVLSGKTATFGVYDDGSKEDVEKAMAIIEKFELTHKINSGILTLSQGEKKRVYIARSWMANAELLILDEPYAGLDLYSRETLLKAINKIGEQDHQSLIYVTHYIEEIVPSITHVLLMKEGKIIAQGKKEEVLTEDNLEAAFKVPVKLHWENGRAWVSVKERETLISNK
jgi:iron complex transport system ATP-binding protein